MPELAAPVDEGHTSYDERGWLTVPPSRARRAVLAAAMTAWLTYCAVLVRTGSPETIAFAVLAAGALLAACATATRRSLAGRAGVHVDRDGISCGRQRIRWCDVGAVTTRSRARIQVVYVGRTAEAERAYLARLSPLRRVIEPADRQVFQAMTIYVPPRARLDAETFAQWLTRLRDQR
ncbi:MAG TPA: hypothetical protein VGN18_06850 [Jatrophihabitans sp.]|jgi:hypothetical protein|uniref:hypothetical protein n=1 Tax=Jatrophihabitans sp. TaxID=1932789 RepID=UPI002E06ABDC|nr:hypothetical protein [Jatrophihabitans sp.]